MYGGKYSRKLLEMEELVENLNLDITSNMWLEWFESGKKYAAAIIPEKSRAKLFLFEDSLKEIKEVDISAFSLDKIREEDPKELSQLISFLSREALQ